MELHKKKLKILAIDDNNDNLISIKALIEESFPDALILTTLSGAIGQELASSEDPDIILLDIVMPEIDGYEVCRKLKADHKLSDIPVVFVTAYNGDKEMRIRALECGAEAFLSKPIDQIELTAQIRAMVKIKTANSEKRDEKARLETLVENQTQELKNNYLASLNLLEDLKKETNAKQKSEEKFQNLFENAPVGLYRTTPDGRILLANKALVEMLGYSSFAELSKRNLEENGFEPTYQRKQFTDRIEKEGEINNLESKWICYNGNVIIVRENAKGIRDSEGKIVFYEGTVEDITERKRAEDELKKNEERFRNISNSISDISYSCKTDADGVYKIDWIFGAYEKITGYTNKEFLAMKCWGTLVVKEDLPVFKTHILDVKSGKSAMCHLRLKHKNGNILWIQASAKCVKQKGSDHSYLFGGITDITDRKVAEEALMKSENHYRSLFENMLNGVAYCKMDYKNDKPYDFTYLSVNKAFETLTGLKNVVGKKVSEVITYIKESDKELFEIYKRVASTGEPEKAETYLHALKMWFSVSVYSPEKGYFVVVFDVTSEKKKAEMALKDSEKKYRLIAERISDVVWIMDLNGKSTFVSPSIEKFTGYSVDEYLAQTMHTRFTPASAAIVIETFNNEIAKYRHLESPPKDYLKKMIIDYRCKDGSVKTGEVAIVPNFDDNNKCIELHGVTRDVTDRKRAENSLRESEEKFREMADLLPQIVFESNMQGKLTYVNKQALKTLGYPEDYFYSDINTVDFYIPNDRKKVVENIKLKKLGKKFGNIEYTMIRKDGSTFPALVYSNPILKNNKMVGLRGIIVDISDRKLAEEVLKESEASLNQAQEIARMGSWERDYITQKTYWSDNYFAINGLKPGAVEPDFEFYRRRIHPDDTHLLDKTHAKIMKDKTPAVLELRIVLPDGTVKWIQNNIVPVTVNNEIVKLKGVIIDITQHKKDQEELTKAKVKAEESDKLKTVFLANMSHEIRTPMNGILGFAWLLKQPKVTVEEQQEFINMIEKSGTRLLNIINDIISITKVESGLMELAISETNINEQMEFIYNFFKHDTSLKGLLFSFENGLSAKKAIIQTDRELMYAILTNLVNNAIKFTNQGTIKFGYILKTDITNLELEFFVKDTGIGIRPEHKELIFERFRQANETLSRNYEGTGLGLSISKAYVEKLGGKIWVESDPDSYRDGTGSTFYFTIPYIPVTKEKEVITNFVSETEDDNAIKSLKILIAEDDITSEMLMTMGVKMFSEEVLKATTGTETVEVCRNNPDIDLILMDIQMPEMDGHEATRRIRKFNKNVVIIAQTAFALAGDKEKAMEAGCNDYISKPISQTLLTALIKKYFF